MRSTIWRHRLNFGRSGSPAPPFLAVMDHLVAASQVQKDVSDAMEDVRSVSLVVDPDSAQSPNLDDQEDRRFQDCDNDGHVPDLYGEGEYGEGLDVQLLPGDNMGCDEETYIDEVEEMELVQLYYGYIQFYCVHTFLGRPHMLMYSDYHDVKLHHGLVEDEGLSHHGFRDITIYIYVPRYRVMKAEYTLLMYRKRWS
jgi:hypothetical protein